jgi:lambda repressor-like predicted transcriptional regulator
MPHRSHIPNTESSQAERTRSDYPPAFVARIYDVPRKGSAYPIDKQWRDRVEARIAEMGISRSEFARRAKVSKASLSEALSPESKQSTLVPAIHKALGWGPPRGLLMSPDLEEIYAVVNSMDPRDQAALLERAIMLRDQRKKNQ